MLAESLLGGKYESLKVDFNFKALAFVVLEVVVSVVVVDVKEPHSSSVTGTFTIFFTNPLLCLGTVLQVSCSAHLQNTSETGEHSSVTTSSHSSLGTSLQTFSASHFGFDISSQTSEVVHFSIFSIEHLGLAVFKSMTSATIFLHSMDGTNLHSVLGLLMHSGTNILEQSVTGTILQSVLVFGLHSLLLIGPMFYCNFYRIFIIISPC